MKYQYVIRMQYLGFRYSGWQRQPGQKTVEGMVRKTLKFILGDIPFRVLAAGRTDAKVSALAAAVALYLDEELHMDGEEFISLFNRNLPPDIRALDISSVPTEFNIIKDSSIKEYTYLFSTGQKIHPFCAPIMACIHEQLDIPLMISAASLFVGTHDFSAYTVKQKGLKDPNRTVTLCELALNTRWQASFFPEQSYLLQIRAEGFMRYQVRMIMGALIELGRGNISLDQVRASLEPGNDTRWTYVAPGSGLALNHLEFG
ncbi:tRNA pseudouridine synthase A [Zeaxanthinibacter enoshimensis]|uniref:tRNA pseudouridine synthase A n=1 Tax=Zeaxanthinibacter enoshimensis TaxID=392009 RepID=A0A4R6TKH5_9FLAO|nr:tRNA pseudouridine(38-40) synthase TruA [Zeaxanthinibacter enoshimensis]TDQ31434.1 tRNA pseudouridine38-40 synthase [Zeaxanthinibacter enoshimensis]